MTLSLTGSIQKKYEYSDYGERSLDSKTEIINNEFGYNGEAHTADGLQYLRSRYYDPVTGVFISADSYRGRFDNPLSQNRYTYCNNNPYKYDDPTGHLPASGINKYASNALMDVGSGTSSDPTVKPPLPKPVKKPVNQQQNTNYNSGMLLRDVGRTPSVKTEAVMFDDGGDAGENSDDDDIGDKAAVIDNDSLQGDEIEEVTGKAESSNVGTETRIDIGNSDDKTIPLIYDGFENNISEIFRTKASAFGQVIKGDELLDSGLNAIDKMAEGRAVHTYIEVEIEKSLLQTGVTVHRDKTIGGITNKKDSKLRPDLVIEIKGKVSVQYIYEIKPDSTYGHLSGPAQLTKYQTELNKRNQNAVIGSHPGVEAWVTENPTIEVNGKKYNLTLQNGLILYKKVSENKPSNPVGIPVIIPDSSPQEQEDKRNVPSMIQVNRDLAFGMALSGAMGLTVGIFGMNSFVNHDLRMR